MRNWLAPAGIAVGVIALSAIALLREPAAFDVTTPEGVVQEYLQGIANEDFNEAFTYLHEESFRGCDAEDIARHTPDDFHSASLNSDGDAFRGEIHFEEEFGRGSPLPDADVWVDVIIQRGDGGPFGGGWDEWASFGLVDEEGFWWIVGDPWPHFRWGCARPGEA